MAYSIFKPGTVLNKVRSFFVVDTVGAVLPAVLSMTVDSDGNVIPIPAGSGGGGGSSTPLDGRILGNAPTRVTAAILTSSYTQLIASSSLQINEQSIFNSTGETLVLAIGAAASEIDQYYIPPGGNGLMDLKIPSGSRVSVKAVSANTSAGELNISWLK